MILHDSTSVIRPGKLRLSEGVAGISRTVKSFVDANHAVILNGDADAFLHLVNRYGRELSMLPIDPTTELYLRDMYWRLRLQCIPGVPEQFQSIALPQVRWHHIGGVPADKAIEGFLVPCNRRHMNPIVIPGEPLTVETVALRVIQIDIPIVDDRNYFDRIWLGPCERCGLVHWTDLVTDQAERDKAIPLYAAWRRNQAKDMLAEFKAIREGKNKPSVEQQAKKHSSRLILP